MYHENYVFPLTEAYLFASEIGGEVEVKTKAIKRRGVINDTFIDEAYGETSQARRALMYVLFTRYGVFEKFEREHWNEMVSSK